MSRHPSTNFLRYGSDDPRPKRTPLRAGALSMFLEAGDLRYIKFGDMEVVRRLYAAVRDANWSTIPGVIDRLQIENSPNDFRVSYRSEHRAGDIHFVWQAEIAGTEDHSLRFTFDGEARTTFLRNRIGLCVLHPAGRCAGARCRAHYAGGAARELVFPQLVAAQQPIDGLCELTGLDHEVEPSVWAELRFAGDLFETEDQRNWIDASYKTYGTPIRLPFPVAIRAGTRIRQDVDLRLVDRRDVVQPSAPERAAQSDIVRITPTARERPGRTATLRPTVASHRIAAIGLAWASHGGELAAIEIERLAALHLAHIRLDVRDRDPSSLDQLPQACEYARQLGAALELAVHVEGHEDGQASAAFLETLRRALKHAGARLARVLAFGARRDKSTPEGVLRLVKAELGGLGAPVGAGSSADMYELNLQRPPGDADFICWSMNPQVHSFDCASIAETPEAAAQQLRSARQYFPSKPLVVSPITLKPRFNAVATGPEPPVPPGELPPPVDPRQMSLFGAGWTLAMLCALCESAADAVTFFETTAWRGVMETQAGPPLPARFPSLPGAVFPLYHVLADVGEFASGAVRSLDFADSPAFAALLLHDKGRQRLLLANLGPEPREIALRGLPQFDRIRRLDDVTVLAAMTDPQIFRRQGQSFRAKSVALPPFGLATLDGRPNEAPRR